jgi:hypothetical protein
MDLQSDFKTSSMKNERKKSSSEDMQREKYITKFSEL